MVWGGELSPEKINTTGWLFNKVEGQSSVTVRPDEQDTLQPDETPDTQAPAQEPAAETDIEAY